MSPIHTLELTPAFLVLAAYLTCQQAKRLRRKRIKGKPAPDAGRYDPSFFLRSLTQSAESGLAFRARTRGEALEWQQALRAKLAELLGGLPDRAAPPDAEVLETRQFDGYSMQRIVFQSRPDLAVLAYLLLPAGAAQPLPVVLCLPGHGRGIDAIAGVDGDGRPFRDGGNYQHEFALQTVRLGMAALAIEPLGFGHRRSAAVRERGASETSCGPAARTALLLGQTLAGWRVGDVLRALDWIETRPELDAGRIGCIGISCGGMTALYAAALDARLRATLVSGYLASFRDSIALAEHCIDNYVPGILRWADMHDIAGLVAPRALFFESGERDSGFPVESCRESFGRIEAIYECMGAPGAAGLEIFPGGHEFWGAQGLPFIARELGASRAPSPQSAPGRSEIGAAENASPRLRTV